MLVCKIILLHFWFIYFGLYNTKLRLMLLPHIIISEFLIMRNNCALPLPNYTLHPHTCGFCPNLDTSTLLFDFITLICLYYCVKFIILFMNIKMYF